MHELIKALVEAFGPSGFEEQTRAVIQAEVEPIADAVEIDALGNLIARKRGNGDGLSVMIAAHMDEIGVMVSHVTDEGFLRFTNIGGVSAHTLLGGRIQFADGTVGVIHADRFEDRSKVHPLDKYFIDVGASSKESCPIGVGMPAGFFRPLLTQGTRLSAKSMDDRIGCYIAIETLRRLRATPHDVSFVFSVQEEVGTRGATTAANGLAPDVGIAIDVTLTGDTPQARTMAVSLGKGPAIKVKDSGMIAHGGLVRLMRQRAEAAGIPYQLEVLDGGTTDAKSMQVSGPGVVAGCLSVPCRYVHSQSETVDLADVENSIELLVAILAQPISL